MSSLIPSERRKNDAANDSAHEPNDHSPPHSEHETNALSVRREVNTRKLRLELFGRNTSHVDNEDQHGHKEVHAYERDNLRTIRVIGNDSAGLEDAKHGDHDR